MNLSQDGTISLHTTMVGSNVVLDQLHHKTLTLVIHANPNRMDCAMEVVTAVGHGPSNRSGQIQMLHVDAKLEITNT